MTLKRTPETPRERPTTFYDARERVLWGENGSRYQCDAQDGPSAILARLEGIYARGAVTCYLVGGATVADAPSPDWYKKAGGDGWRVEYRHDSTPARRTATYTRADGTGPHVQFRHSAAWFGAERHVAHMRSAFRIASSRLDHLFGSGVLLGSPAQTGQALLLRALPFGAEYETAPDDLQAHIRANSPQARREVYPSHYGDTIPAFCYYDARLAYGACVRGVPCGEVFHRTPTRAGGTLDIDPYARALWLCEWRVPPRWEHIGILPERPERPDEPWGWPREAGTWHKGWIWSPALAAARNESWDIRVREGYEWTPRTARGSDPLRMWGDKLLALYMEATPERYGPDGVAPLVRSIARSVLLSTIGAFHRRDTKQTHIVPLDGAVDFPMDYPRERKPWGWEIEVPVPLSPHAARFAHPEWSAWVWATQYSRMTRRMLSRYQGDVIGCNTDAIYTTALQADWTDSGRVGEYRLKGRLRGARPTPRTLAELGKLKTESEGEA